jgi:hypothetical protein
MVAIGSEIIDALINLGKQNELNLDRLGSELQLLRANKSLNFRS